MKSHVIRLAMAFFVAHALSLLLVRYGGPLAPAWPPIGVALAALIWLPASHRPLVFVGVIVLDTLSNAMQGYATLGGHPNPATRGHLKTGHHDE